MFKSLFSKTGADNRKLQRHPAVQTGLRLIQTHWVENHQAIKDFPAKFVQERAELWMDDIVKIALSPSPLMANREAVAVCVLELAEVHVLVIDPAPAEDLDGLRGQPGITGKLKHRLFELYQVDTGLQDYFKQLELTPKNWVDAWDPILFGYRLHHARAHVFQGLRVVFGDQATNPADDWFRPFHAAMCGFREAQYWRSLGEPQAFESGPEDFAYLKPLLLSLFMNCVQDGAPNPFLEWKQRIADTEKGDSTWRSGSWLA